MALEGSLKDFGLADILQLIYVQKKTGTLKMKNASSESKVLFEHGLIVTADSSNLEGVNKIGEILLRSGRISQDQLKYALATQRQTNKKVGVVLVEMGAIAKEYLMKALGLHVKEAVFSLFRWKEGHYSFEPSDISYERDYGSPINTEFLIMEWVRRIDEWPYIEKKIPNLGFVFERIKENTDQVRVVSSEEESQDGMFGESRKEEGIQITQEEMIVYDLIDGQQDVRQLIEVANLGEFETCKALSNLLTAGLIVRKSSAEPQKTEEEKGVGTRQISSRLTVPQLISSVLMLACLVFLSHSAGNFINTMHRTIETAEYYDRLKTSNQVKQVGSSILTYYYRNNRLPVSLELLNREGYPAGPILASEGRAMIYEPDDITGVFSIRVQD